MGASQGTGHTQTLASMSHSLRTSVTGCCWLLNSRKASAVGVHHLDTTVVSEGSRPKRQNAHLVYSH